MTDTTNSTNANSTKDQTFASRIQSGISTVEAWDDDPSLLAECRLLIPFAELMAEDSKYKRDDDWQYQGNALFLKRLAVHFQTDVMTWVNAPPCGNCGNKENMQAQETRSAQTPEEIEGQARRVEVYKCPNCDATTTFPRYNSCRKLLETRRGRCGEYANLFGLYCRAAGFETRYVSDWTDHVWIEALVDGDHWIMADSCEGTIDRPSMYESGWGKQLNYIVGISTNGVVDVTPRYTRKFPTPEFQQRRRQIASSEIASDQIVQRFQDRVRQNLSAKAVQTLVKRDEMERSHLQKLKSISEWSEAEKHGRGRISGSLEWRLQRHEAGSQQQESDGKKHSVVRGLYREQFYPTSGNTVRMEVSSQGIFVSGIQCDVGGPNNTVSVVVVDDVHLGCILQSRAFASWADVAAFLQTIPLGRMVLLKGSVQEDELNKEGLVKQFQVLEGFQIPFPSQTVAFLGRLGAKPDWTLCTDGDEPISVEFPNVTRSAETNLRTELNTVPQRVLGRLPETIMPLQTQLMASEDQKRTAFLKYVEEHPNIAGYTTKPSNPIYLMDNSSFPFHESKGDWSTFHSLPQVLVPNQTATANNNNTADVPKFELPLEDTFFNALLGPSLLVKSGSGTTTMPTSEALRHSRLVGLYFSAHWCPPCKRFTPMLSELYTLLKEENGPFHGLEMIFVSSDRSSAEFQQYYASMPWKAVPYDETRMRPQNISMRYGVRGIPALVILDAVSGQVVASIEQARNEVTQACQRGEAAIEALFQTTWLGRLPPESRELFNLLKLSSEEGETNEQAKESSIVDERDAYLTKTDNPWAGKPTLKNLDFGVAGKKANGTATTAANAAALKKDDTKIILTTMLKYLDNAVKQPWNPKFRQFKLSNKIVDKAMRLEGAIDFIESFGMTIVPTLDDFMVSIPLAADVDQMQSSMTNALKECE